MAIVIDIRGTHGSGKSWIVHTLLDRGNTPILEDGRQIGHLLTSIDCGVVGLYNRVCGGCDGINSAGEVVRRVELLATRHRYVLLEGILVSHTFRRYSELAGRMQNYRFLFLNTPLNTCIKRVRTRRRFAGNDKPLNPKNLVKDWRQIWIRTREKCVAAGHTVEIVDWQNPMKIVMEQFDA